MEETMKLRVMITRKGGSKEFVIQQLWRGAGSDGELWTEWRDLPIVDEDGNPE